MNKMPLIILFMKQFLSLFRHRAFLNLLQLIIDFCLHPSLAHLEAFFWSKKIGQCPIMSSLVIVEGPGCGAMDGFLAGEL